MSRTHSLVVTIILVGAAATGLSQGVVSDRDVARKAERFMKGVADAEGFSGSVLVARRGKTVFSNAYGLANIELAVPNTPQTVFRIASITKSFTATAIMLLQERGRLKVTDSVCQYVDACPSSWQPITLRNLLTHTAGLPAYNRATDGAISVAVTHDEILERLRSQPLEFAPGEKFSYTNSGYYILGLIIERLAQRPYGEFLEQNIFAPLGMTHTGDFSNGRIVKNRAAGYTLPQGGVVANSLYSDPSISFAAASLWSTTEDLLLFDTAFHQDKLVSRKSRDEMLAPFKERYGYGWEMSQEGARSVVGHAGTTWGFTCDLVHYVADDVVVIILSNKPGAGDLDTIGTGLAAIAFGERSEEQDSIPQETPAVSSTAQ